MGEIAEMMLDGTLCAGCGEYLGSDNGYSSYCGACAREERDSRPRSNKVECPICQRRVKAAGLADHTRVVHPEGR